MTPTGRPPTIRERDDRGQPVVRVPLNPEGSAWATVDAEDFDRLTEELSRSWFVNKCGCGYEYVKAGVWGAPGNLVVVSRVILGASRGQAVHFKTHDRRDLRRCNLSLRKDRSAKRDHHRDASRAVRL